MKTVDEAKQYLRDNLQKGAHCPVCTQWARMNKMPFHSGMALTLIFIYKATMQGKTDNGWLHVENYLVEIGSKIKGVHSKLEYWGLLERKPNLDDPKKKENGFWRITEKGKLFVEGKLVVPSHVKTFNKKQYGFSQKNIDIRGALGKKFDYSELMS